MFDLLHEIGQTLRNNKLRTILTGISVAWGIFMLIILLGAARGVANSFDKQSSSEAHNVISIWGGRTTKAYKGYRDGRWIGLRNGDGDALKEDHPHLVSYVAAEASVDNATVASDREVISGGLTAVSPTAILNKKIPITHGRFINELDMQQGRRVMVLSESHAEQLFGSADDAIGRTVRSMGLGWTVVGGEVGDRIVPGDEPAVCQNVHVYSSFSYIKIHKEKCSRPRGLKHSTKAE